MPKRAFYYLFVNCNSIRRFFCNEALSRPNSAGCNSPNPDGTNLRFETPFLINSFTTAVERNNDNCILFEYPRVPANTGLLSVCPSTRIIQSISDGIILSKS